MSKIKDNRAEVFASFDVDFVVKIMGIFHFFYFGNTG